MSGTLYGIDTETVTVVTGHSYSRFPDRVTLTFEEEPQLWRLASKGFELDGKKFGVLSWRFTRQVDARAFAARKRMQIVATFE